MTKTQKYGIVNYIAALLVFSCANLGMLMGAAIDTISQAWPDVSMTSIRMILTLPPLVSLPFMLCIGGIVGKKISYRFCAIVGTLLAFIGGVGPYFIYSSWTIVLVFRALMGVGTGLLVVRNSLLTRCIPKEKLAAYMGYGAAINTLANSGVQALVGILTTYSWRHVFLANGFAIVVVIFMLVFLKEPEKEEDAPAAESGSVAAAPVGSQRMSWKVYFYIAFQFLGTLTLYPLTACLSSFAADYQITSAAMVGITLSIYALAGAVVNLVINPIKKALGRYTLGLMSLLVAAGYAMVLYIHSFPAMFAGCILAGAGYFVVCTMLQVYNAEETPASRMPFISAVILTMIQLGVFASNYFISGCQAVFHLATEADSSFLGGLIAFAVLGIISIVLRVEPKKAD